MSEASTASASSNSLFSIRSAREDDMPWIAAISNDVGLPVIESIDNASVAVNDEDIPVGFIRIKLLEGASAPSASQPYVYPVAVLRSWQGYDVGTALMEYALKVYGKLLLVACSPSRGFYEKLGFEKLAWKEVAPEIARDCNLCADAETCTPQPFAKYSDSILT